MRYLQRHLLEVRSSIKLTDIEEAYDVYFSRFLGLFVAKAGVRGHWHPNHVSIASLLIGIFGGVLLFFQNDLWLILTAGVLITISGILDSADGQLARMTNQSSEVGRIIDGVIDTIVFFTCYMYGTIHFLFEWGWPALLLGIVSVYTFGIKTSTYDFYKSEYLRLIAKTSSGHIPMSVNEIKRMGDKPYHFFLHFMNRAFTSSQLLFATRNRKMREQMTMLSERFPVEFEKRYRELNRPLMPIWAWVCGLNIHRNGMIIFSLFGRFDLYLFVSLAYGVLLVPLWYVQRSADRKLMATFG